MTLPKADAYFFYVSAFSRRSRIDAAIQYMEQNLSTLLSRDDVAKQVFFRPTILVICLSR